MYEMGIGICVVVETHLRSAEVDRLKFRDYCVVASKSRETTGRIGGGVLILVNTKIGATRFTLPTRVLAPIESCTIKLYPAANPQTVMLITGVYIPSGSTGKLTQIHLHRLSAPVANPKGGGPIHMFSLVILTQPHGLCSLKNGG